VEVMPVWSLKALEGIFDPPGPAVVAVLDELVELQAAPVAASSTTMPAAAIRIFHDADTNAPPRNSVRIAARSRPCRRPVPR